MIQTQAIGLAIASVGITLAAADAIDYGGIVNNSTAVILFALGIITIYNRHRGDSAKILRESRDDWEKHAKELEAENKELEKRPDMAELMDLVRTQAEGGTAMAQTILTQLKQTGDQIRSIGDLMQEHDRRAVGRIDRLADMLEARESRFRRNDQT